jgi:hypothetical protein
MMTKMTEEEGFDDEAESDDEDDEGNKIRNRYHY